LIGFEPIGEVFAHLSHPGTDSLVFLDDSIENVSVFAVLVEVQLNEMAKDYYICQRELVANQIRCLHRLQMILKLFKNAWPVFRHEVEKYLLSFTIPWMKRHKEGCILRNYLLEGVNQVILLKTVERI